MAASRRVSVKARKGKRVGDGGTSFRELELEARQRLQRSTLSTSRPVHPDVLVVAIDFGTTFSGYAFSSKTDFNRDPLKVDCLNVEVRNTDFDRMTHRVPTCILFTPDRKFASFGLEAEDRYARLIDEDRTEASKWFFFDRFKMELHRQAHLTRDLVIMDKTKKKSMRGLDIFSEAIRYLKNHALHKLQKEEEDEIKWVLTVPAIWTDGSRQFMREAATVAGIADDRLVLALEPEAASIYCLRYFQSQPSSPSTGFTGSGKRFMTVDCGGGTVDISVFEVRRGGNLEQLHRPEGAPCGGVKVDDGFKAFLNEIMGFDGVASIDNTEMLDLMRKFEMAKLQTGFSDKFPIRIPPSLQENLSVCLRDTKYDGKVSIVKRRLLVDKSIALSFYNESKEGIIAAMTRVLQSETVGRVDAILLVGGLSESKVIQDKVTSAFPEERVLVPPSPSLTVLMGAVQYGHCPQVISTRVAPFTYGVNTNEVFVEGEHDEAKAIVTEGVKLCTVVFDVYIRINDIVSLDQQLPFKEFCPACTGQTQIYFNIYRTRSPCPKYVTEEGCEKIGHFTVEMPDLTGEKERRVHATMSVSGTELRVIARDGNTGKEFSTTCDLLSS